MNHHDLIAQRAAEAQAEIREMARRAQEEIAKRFEFLARSNGQKRRHAKRRAP